jgi:hypothetical protein
MSLRGWEPLKCSHVVASMPNTAMPCGSEEFLAVHQLKWREGQGTTSTQTSWKCAKCGAIAGTSKMIDIVQKEYLQRKIDELTEQQKIG